MCRIAGIIACRMTAGEAENKVRAMCRVLQHGGPDDEGFFTDEKANLVFGHRRLSIIDLSRNGHQPMADVQQKVWITFNGEIYNYLDLKKQLAAAGACFRSNSDTEVILQAYLYWGAAAFARFRGMFAFALYDKEKALTYLVRDTMGIKPLYYHIKNGALSFASEVKAFKLAGVTDEVDETWRVRLLAFGHIPEPYTTLKNVLSLPKAHFLCWDHHHNNYKITAYADQARPCPDITNMDQAKGLLHEALKAAVKRQLIADAPIGVFLSGGTDSSLLTLLANEEKKQQLKTISIFFNEKAYDERGYQNLVLDKIAGEKYTHLVQQNDFNELLPSILNDMDTPTTDGINTWFISRYAHGDGLKAVLSGVGADELFGGYPSFRRIRYLHYLRQLPSWLYSPANYFKTDKFRKISFLEHDHPLADYLLMRGLFVPSKIAGILDADVKQVNDILFNGDAIPDLGPYDEVHAAWFETNLYMQNQLLRDTDVMSMAHGLEVRVPFLDEDLQELAQNISPRIRFDNKQPKKLLVDSFIDILPKQTWDRPKMGFIFPLQHWMGQHSQISDETFYKNKVAQNFVKRFKKGDVHWSKIFALYLVQMHG